LLLPAAGKPAFALKISETNAPSVSQRTNAHSLGRYGQV